MKKKLLNGDARRRLESWIDTYVNESINLDSPPIFRKWAAISTIAAALEQKVWIQTSSPIYPNLYIFIIGHPGTGKTRAVRMSRSYIRTIEELHLAPISLTWASLVDSLVESKRLINPLDTAMEFNSLYICADELGAFIHKYDNEMIDGLSALYDPDVYSQRRRSTNLNIKILSPQINILAGSTPQNLTDFLPDKAWGQGFTSRLIMVFSDERIIGDDFAPVATVQSADLEHDLLAIHNLIGQFQVTEDYRIAINNWRQLGEPPVPNHPKLIHYVTRRKVHLYKLSMISAVDRSNALILTKADFNRALGWLTEAEETMPEIFKAGAVNADSLAMDEIKHFVMISDSGNGVTEQQITQFAMDRIPLHSIMRVVELLEHSGMIHCLKINRQGYKIFTAATIPQGPLQ